MGARRRPRQESVPPHPPLKMTMNQNMGRQISRSIRLSKANGERAQDVEKHHREAKLPPNLLLNPSTRQPKKPFPSLSGVVAGDRCERERLLITALHLPSMT